MRRIKDSEIPFLSFLSATTPSTVEVHNVFFKNFSLICRDTANGYIYSFQDRKLKRQPLYCDKKPEILMYFDDPSFDALQNIFTVMTIHHHQTLLSLKQQIYKKTIKKIVKTASDQKNLRFRNIESNAEGRDIGSNLRLTPN